MIYHCIRTESVPGNSTLNTVISKLMSMILYIKNRTKIPRGINPGDDVNQVEEDIKRADNAKILLCLILGYPCVYDKERDSRSFIFGIDFIGSSILLVKLFFMSPLVSYHPGP